MSSFYLERSKMGIAAMVEALSWEIDDVKLFLVLSRYAGEFNHVKLDLPFSGTAEEFVNLLVPKDKPETKEMLLTDRMSAKDLLNLKAYLVPKNSSIPLVLKAVPMYDLITEDFDLKAEHKTFGRHATWEVEVNMFGFPLVYYPDSKDETAELVKPGASLKFRTKPHPTLKNTRVLPDEITMGDIEDLAGFICESKIRRIERVHSYSGLSTTFNIGPEKGRVVIYDCGEQFAFGDFDLVQGEEGVDAADSMFQWLKLVDTTFMKGAAINLLNGTQIIFHWVTDDLEVLLKHIEKISPIKFPWGHEGLTHHPVFRNLSDSHIYEDRKGFLLRN